MPSRRIPADHGGLDDERLPFPRRAQRSCHDGLRVAVARGAVVDAGARPRRRRAASARRSARRPAAPSSSSSGNETGAADAGVQPRHLRERQVLGKPSGRQPLAGTGQYREKGAAGRDADAGCRDRTTQRHAGAVERMFQQRGIAIRGPQEDRHLVEPHAAARLRDDPPRDLDAFAPFARAPKTTRRRPCDVAHRRLAPGRRDTAAAPTRSLSPFCSRTSGWTPKRRETIERRDVAERDGHEHRARARAGRSVAGAARIDSCARTRLHASIRARRRAARAALTTAAAQRVARRRALELPRRRIEQPGAIGRRGGGELLVEPFEERPQVAAAERQRRRRPAGHVRQPQFRERPRERPRETRAFARRARNSRARPRATPRTRRAPRPPPRRDR